MNSRNHAWVSGAVALAVYVAATILLTWPLAPGLADSLPSPGFKFEIDRLYSIWVLSWQTHALTTASAHFADANIYHPTPDALFYGPMGMGSLPYFAPVFLISGNPFLAINVTLLGCLALCAWTTHLAVRHWTGSELAGFVSGVSVLGSRWLVDRYVPAVPHFASLHLIPVLMLLASRPFTRWSQALWFAPIVALQCATDLVYVMPVVIATLGLVCLARLVHPDTRVAGLRLLAAILLGLSALAPVAAGYLRVAARNPDLERQSAWYWFPPEVPATHLPAGLVDTTRAAAIAPAAALCLVIGILAAVLRRRVDDANPTRRSGWRAGALWASVGLLLSLGPGVHLGAAYVRSPLAVATDWFPALARIRIPDRLGVAALFGLAVLLGMAFAACERWIVHATRRPSLGRALAVAVALAIAGGAYFDWGGSVGHAPSYLRYPAPRVPTSIVERLRHQPGPLIELPVPSADHGITATAQAMVHSTFHWCPLVSGYSSYFPPELPRRLDLARSLPNPKALEALRRETGLQYVWVHMDQFDTSSQKVFTDLAARPSARLRRVAHDGPDWLFSVAP